MVHPAFIYVLLLLVSFTMQLTCAQNMAVQSAPLPVVEGKINGMDVVAQGDSVAFFAGQLPGGYSDEPCAEDLHCAMHKNHTRAVMISPDGVFLQLSPDHLEKDEDEEDDSNSIVLPSQTLNTLDSSSSFSFKELFISTEEIESTPTLATLYTGNPVVDQTPGLAWINSETIKLLATTVETLGFLSTSATSTTGDDFTLVNPSPTETVKVMTITGELDGLRRQLMASATVPVPTPVQTKRGDPELESDEVWLETELDVINIRPSPSGQYGKNSGGINAFSFSVKQVPTVSEQQESGSTSTEARFTEIKVPSETLLRGTDMQAQPTIARDRFCEYSMTWPKRTRSLAAFHGFSVESKPAIFSDQDLIGAGHFGSVFKAKAIDGREVAVKRSPKDQLRGSYCLAEREKQNLEYISRFNFQYFIDYLGGYVQGDYVHFMLELGDVQLEELLEKNIEKINVQSFNNIAFQTMSMIEFLDKIKMRHSDMHFTNMVYFYSTDKIKLVDFERSSFPEDNDYHTPFLDLSVLGRHLIELQLKMKGYSEDEVWDKRAIFFESSRFDHVLGRDDLWFKDLNQDSKYTIAATIILGKAKGKETVGRKDCFSPRFRLPPLES